LVVLGGGIVGGLAGWHGSVAYVEAFPRPGFEDIGVVLGVTPLAVLVGAGLGVWGTLRLFGYARPVLTAVLFSLLIVVLVPAIAATGSVVLPVNIGIPSGTAFTVVLSTLVSAQVSRMVVARRPSASKATHRVP
jgi:hypothetical protein